MVYGLSVGLFFSLTVWALGSLAVPSTRPRRTRSVARVSGQDLTITRNGSPVSVFPMVIIFGILGVGMIWAAFAEFLHSPWTRDVVIGWLLLLSAVLVLWSGFFFLMSELGPTSLQLTGSTLRSVSVGRALSRPS